MRGLLPRIIVFALLGVGAAADIRAQALPEEALPAQALPAQAESPLADPTLADPCHADRLSEARGATDHADYTRALDLYQACLAQDPDSYDALGGMARALAFSNARLKALETYTRFEALYPDDPDALLGRGRLFAWLQRYEEAEQDLLRVTRLTPQYADAWRALGDVYLWSDQPERAVHAYEKGAALQPGNPDFLVAQAKAHRVLRQLDKARRDVLEARNLGGDPAEANTLLRQLDQLTVKDLWEISLGYDQDTFVRDLERWHMTRLAARRDWSSFSLGVESLTGSRFARWDHGLAIDTYFSTWSRAYANVRVQTATRASFLPQLDITTMLYQGLGGIWEVSAGYRFLGFEGESAHLLSAGAAANIRSWLLRWQSTLVANDTTVSHTFMARRTLLTSDDFVEIGVGVGEESVPLGRGDTRNRKDYFLRARAQWFMLPRFGVNLAADMGAKEDWPRRFGVGLGFIVRLGWGQAEPSPPPRSA